MCAVRTATILYEFVMNLPHFSLYTNAYRLQVIEEVTGVCEVCETPQHYRYTGLFYSQEEVGYICPWCVANGAAVTKFSGRFNDEMGIEGTEFGAENADGVVNVTWTISDTDISQVSRHTPATKVGNKDGGWCIVANLVRLLIMPTVPCWHRYGMKSKPMFWPTVFLWIG